MYYDMSEIDPESQYGEWRVKPMFKVKHGTQDATQQHWRIDVHGWGTLWAVGTEAQAEEWRRHKANWEHAVARKSICTDEEKAGRKFDNLSDLL